MWFLRVQTDLMVTVLDFVVQPLQVIDGTSDVEMSSSSKKTMDKLELHLPAKTQYCSARGVLLQY